jgi:alkylation response protein AidB-like acyl-CoA dehydrogenase
MEYRWCAEDQAFREQARKWLQTHRPREARPDEPVSQKTFDLAWQKAQYEGGWGGLAWPTEYGGKGLSLARQLIWHEEYARARSPHVLNAAWLGLNHAGPTLMVKGTAEQKAFHLPRILRGDVSWCQGFSEPNAGSDLASLHTRGVVDGDCLIVNGQKTWTSFAQVADYMELLVRTNPDPKLRHRGLTWVIADMRLPGIDIRPIKSMTGKNHNAEVFFDDVAIPLENVVGSIDGGWKVAMATLTFERGTAGLGEICQLEVLCEELTDAVKSMAARRSGGTTFDADEIGIRLGQIRAETLALKALAHLTLSRSEAGTLGAESSIVRLAQGEIDQRLGALALDVLGLLGIDRSVRPHWSYHYLFSYCQTIAGGTAEIQRNLIGERVLGLPR